MRYVQIVQMQQSDKSFYEIYIWLECKGWPCMLPLGQSMHPIPLVSWSAYDDTRFADTHPDPNLRGRQCKLNWGQTVKHKELRVATRTRPSNECTSLDVSTFIKDYLLLILQLHQPRGEHTQCQVQWDSLFHLSLEPGPTHHFIWEFGHVIYTSTKAICHNLNLSDASQLCAEGTEWWILLRQNILLECGLYFPSRCVEENSWEFNWNNKDRWAETWRIDSNHTTHLFLEALIWCPANT